MNNLKLIIVSGLPGSGKSTISEAVAENLKLPLFSVDPIESSIIKSGIEKSFNTGLAAYLVVENLVAQQLDLGISCIVDAVSSVKEAKDMWRSLSTKYDAKLVIIECVLDEEIHKKRVELRVRNMYGIPEVSWEDVQKSREEYLPWAEQRLILDTANTYSENIKKVLDYIAL